MSVAIHLAEPVAERLEGLRERIGAGLPHLLEELGEEVAEQVDRRIREEKAAPDGTRWPLWSPRYKATRHAGHRLLMGEGNLIDSIQHFLTGPDTVVIGSPRVYAATHQFGDEGRGIPARPFLGYSARDIDDLNEVIDDWLRERAA